MYFFIFATKINLIMKKVFLKVLTIGFLSSVILSCQSEAKKDSADSTAVSMSDSTKMADSLAAIPVIEPTKEEITKAEVKAPDFSNSEVNDGLNEFNSLKTEYEKALKSKNSAEIKAINDKYNTWVMKTAAYGSKLPSDENQKFINYYEKLSQQWNIITRQANKK